MEIHSFGTHFDGDLQQYICDDCRVHLRGAAAWLKVAGIRECHRTEPDIELRPLVA